MLKHCQGRGNKSKGAINLKLKIISTLTRVVQLLLLYGFWTDFHCPEGDTQYLKPSPTFAANISFFVPIV
jgi:hypothetical protein